MSIDQWLLLGQLVVALLMAWSLIQGSSSLALARRQFDALIDPLIEVDSHGGEAASIIIKNVGGINISNLRVHAIMTGRYDPQTFELTNADLERPTREIYWPTLKLRESCTVPVNGTFHFRAKKEDSRDQDVIALVFRYERAADLKVFYYLYSGTVKNAKNYMTCFPVVLGSQSTMSGIPSENYKRLRHNIRKHIMDHLAIDSLAGM